jgi:3-oxoacyl-[acyl-carrier protein] reductase
MNLGLKDRVAVVTGGSKGIGKAIAQGFAAQGSNLVLLARGKELLEKTAAEIREESGVTVLAIPCDITSLDSVGVAAAATKKQFETIHVIVNNAGGPIRRMDRQITWADREWTEDVDLKLIGMLRVIQAFLPYIAKDGAGRIINISGVAGSNVWAPALTHGLNNAAMNQGTAYLAQDLVGDKITVNSVVPGLVGTETREVWAENMSKQQGKSKAEFLTEFCRRMGILSGRWASVQEVADTVLFLASDRAQYINGAQIVIDGGLSVNARPA